MSVELVADGNVETLLISGGRVLTPAGMKRADVLVRGSRIAVVGDGIRDVAGQVLDAKGKIVLPGLCNAHTHTHNVLARGLFDIGCLEMLINIQVPAALGRTVEETYLAAAWNALENLKAGNTSVCDQFLTLPAPSLEHIEAVVRAYGDIGLRASIAPLVSDLPFYETIPGLLESLPDDLRGAVAGRTPVAVRFRTLEEAVDRWHGSSGGRISVGVAPAIPLLCTDDLLVSCRELAESRHLNVYMHTAESYVQSIASAQRYGESVVAHVQRIGCLTDRSILAHSVWLSNSDLDLIADAHSVVVHVPSSNARLGSGIARVRAMLARGIGVALGTDGAACSDHQSVFEAMRMAAVVSRVRTVAQADWLAAPEAFAMAVDLTARVLGGEARIGAVAPGQKADLILVDATAPCFHPENDFLTQLVLAGTGSIVDTVLVDGRIVLRGGRSTLVDEGTLLEAVDRAGNALRGRNASEWETTNRLAPYIATSCLGITYDSSPAWPDYVS